jgi:hypothetical protein
MQKTDRILQGIAMMLTVAGSLALCAQCYWLLQVAPSMRTHGAYLLAAQMERAAPVRTAEALQWIAAGGRWRDEGRRCMLRNK